MPILKLAKCPSCGKTKATIDGLLLCCREEKRIDSTICLPTLHFFHLGRQFQFHLSPQEVRFIRLLMTPVGRMRSMKEMIEYIYPEEDGGPDFAFECVRKDIHWLRKRFRGSGLWIKVIWGRGLMLTVGEPETLVRPWSKQRKAKFWAKKLREEDARGRAKAE